MKLEIDLVPSSSWFSNLRSILEPKQWNTLRKECYKKSGYRCQICDGVGKKHPVECHEVWEYDEKNCIQKLISLIALCPNCHEVKHIGLATVRNRRKYAINHFCKINECTISCAENEIAKAFVIWKERNKIEWKLDISIIDK